MSDERPHPQYGEYASPEQQAKAMGLKHVPPITPVLAPGVSGPAAQLPPRPYNLSGSVATAPVTPRRWDLTVSAILLGYGLFTVVSGFFQYADLGSLINRVYEAQGVTGAFSSNRLAGVLAIVINVSDVVLFLATTLITVRVLRRGKVAFYIPLIGGAIAGIVVMICVLTLIVGDPSFMAFIRGGK